VLPEYFIRMLTDQGDMVFDPFAGSCVTGEVAERLKRRWMCCDLVEDYLNGALARFKRAESLFPEVGKVKNIAYNLYHPSTMWGNGDDQLLSTDGGKSRKNGRTVAYPVSKASTVTAVREKGIKETIKRRKQKPNKKSYLYTRV
ncbi:site-specific DNA-methyltransferase, partial [Patescibacteria group bacterium]|nr:site-specific DNA-methyltransferase [Patescibacteria group bacterium]